MYRYGFDKKTLYIIIGVLIAITLINLGTNSLIGLLFSIPGVLLAMSFHEFAHAYAAVKLGDPTPRNQGRLTLDPLKHIDPVGIFTLIVAHIGWGKPVQINPNNFTKVSKSKGEAIVALAGPLMNFLLSFVLILIYYAIMIFLPETPIMTSNFAIEIVNIIITILYYAIVVNIGLGVFNLIPIPPLDGSKIFLKLLPYKAQRWIDENLYMISIIFLILCLTRILGYITSPIIEIIMNGLEFLAYKIFSIFI